MPAVTTTPDPKLDKIVHSTLDYGQAVELIKRKSRGRKIYMSVGTFVPFKVQNPVKDSTQGTIIRDLIETNRESALRFLDKALPLHWRDKINVRIGVSKFCIFIGDSPP